MKKNTLILILAVAFSLPSFAQLEVGANYAYLMNGKVHGYYGTLDFKDNSAFSVNVSYDLDQYTAVEINFTNQSTDAVLIYPPGDGPIRTSQNWYQLATVRSIGGYGTVEPFGYGSLGATQYTFEKQGTSDQWFFSVGIGAGAKVHLSDRIGLRLQGRFLLPMTFSGVGIGCGIGTGGAGCGGGATFWAPMVSGDLSAGVYLKLGE